MAPWPRGRLSGPRDSHLETQASSTCHPSLLWQLRWLGFENYKFLQHHVTIFTVSSYSPSLYAQPLGHWGTSGPPKPRNDLSHSQRDHESMKTYTPFRIAVIPGCFNGRRVTGNDTISGFNGSFSHQLRGLSICESFKSLLKRDFWLLSLRPVCSGKNTTQVSRGTLVPWFLVVIQFRHITCPGCLSVVMFWGWRHICILRAMAAVLSNS